MGQILSWIRGTPSRDAPALKDVSVEEQSQSGQTTPKPAAPVSHYEQKTSAGSNMPSKPAVTTTTGSSTTTTGSSTSVTGSSTAVTGSASKATASAGVTTKVETTSEAKVEPGKAAQAPAPATAAPAKTTAPATAAPTKPAAPATTTTAPAKPTAPATTTAAPAKPTATTTAAPAKPTTSATAKPTATITSTAAQTKVQTEVPPSKAKAKQPEVDPLDALASSLPTEAESRPQPKYKGPEVKEGVTSEKGVRVGEREDTLPPGYRAQDMRPVPADVKPKDVPKPISTDDALDLLSDGFSSSTAAPQKEKSHHVETVSAPKTAPSNFAPAPPVGKKSEAVAPPADKKAKMETTSKEKSAAAPKVQDPKPTSPSSDLSLDALSALEGMLPTAQVTPEPAPVRPEDLVAEGKVKKEKGVRVGEREDSLPPEYRFKGEDHKKLPPAPKQPSLDTDDALALLSGDFSTPSSAPSTQKSGPVSPAPPADKKPRVDDFSLEGALSTASAQKVESVLPPSSLAKSSDKTQTKSESKKTATDLPDAAPLSPPSDLSLDALSALEGMLPTAQVTPEPAPVRPEDLVAEGKVKKEKGVRVGEREDSLPPKYRFKEEDHKKLPPAPKQPSLDTDDALALLSGDFSTPSSAPSTQATATVPLTIREQDICKFPARQPLPMAPVEVPVLISDSPSKSAEDTALEALGDDFLASSAAPTVQSSACPPMKPPKMSDCPPVKPPVQTTEINIVVEELTPGADGALDALSDSLKDIAPTPQPEPPMPTKVVKEKTIEKEHLTKMGERDDTLPPEYRPTEKDKKKMAEEKNKVSDTPKEKPIDDKTALDFLSGDLSDPVCAAGGAVTTETQAGNTPTQKPMSGPVLQSLSDTLLPEKVKSKSDKPKKPVSEEPSNLLPAPHSTDVVSKKGGKS